MGSSSPAAALRFLLLLLLCAVLCHSPAQATPPHLTHDKQVVCYWQSYSVRKYEAKLTPFKVEDIDTSLCTSLVYLHGGLDWDCKLGSGRPHIDIGMGYLRKAGELK